MGSTASRVSSHIDKISSSSASTRESAALGLARLAIETPASRMIIVETPGALRALIHAFGDHEKEVRRLSILAVANIALESTAARTAIVAIPGALAAFVPLLTDPEREVIEFTAWALENLSLDPIGNRDLIVATPGLLSALIESMKYPDGKETAHATGALTNLTKSPGNRAAILAIPNALPTLVTTLYYAGTKILIIVTRVLGNLAMDNPACCAALLEMGCVDRLLGLKSRVGWLSDREERKEFSICSTWALVSLVIDFPEYHLVMKREGAMVHLQKLLEQSNPEVRDIAARAIARLEAVDESSVDSDALEKLRIERSVHWYVNGLNSPSARARERGALCLMKILSSSQFADAPANRALATTPAALDTVIRALSDSEMQVRAYSASILDILASSGYREVIVSTTGAITAISHLLTDASAEVRAKAAHVLMTVIEKHTREEISISISTLLPALVSALADPDETIRKSIVMALDSLGSGHARNRRLIINTGCIDTIVVFLTEAESHHDRNFSVVCAVALVNLAGDLPEYRSRIRDAGAIPILRAFSSKLSVDRAERDSINRAIARLETLEDAASEASEVLTPPLTIPNIIGVPDDRDCLYRAVILGALLPVASNPSEFSRVASQLFGTEVLNDAVSIPTIPVSAVGGDNIDLPKFEIIVPESFSGGTSGAETDSSSFIPSLFRHLRAPSSYVRKHAAAELATFAGDPGKQALIVQMPDAILEFVRLLRDEDADVREMAAAALSNLAVYAENRLLVGRAPRAIPELIRLLSDDNHKVSRQVKWALSNLAFDPTNKKEIIVLGGLSDLFHSSVVRTNHLGPFARPLPVIPPLVLQLRDSSNHIKESALRALFIASNPADEEACLLIGSTPGVIPELVRLFSDGHVDFRKMAVLVLLSLAYHDVNRLLVGSTPGAISGLVRLLRDDDATVRAGTEAILADLALDPDYKIAIDSAKERVGEVSAVLMSSLNNSISRFNGQWNDTMLTPDFERLTLCFRERVAQYLEDHLVESLSTYNSFSGVRNLISGRLEPDMTMGEFREYLAARRAEHAWGGRLEIFAMERLLEKRIHVNLWEGEGLTLVGSGFEDTIGIRLVSTAMREDREHYHVMADLLQPDPEIVGIASWVLNGDGAGAAELFRAVQAGTPGILLMFFSAGPESEVGPAALLRALQGLDLSFDLTPDEETYCAAPAEVELMGPSERKEAIVKINTLKHILGQDKRKLQENADRAKRILLKEAKANQTVLALSRYCGTSFSMMGGPAARIESRIATFSAVKKTESERTTNPIMLEIVDLVVRQTMALLALMKAENEIGKSTFSVDLSRCAIDDEILRTLVIPLIESRRDVEMIDLSQCMLTIGCIPAITELLRRNSSITHVNLNQNFIYSALGRGFTELTELISVGRRVVINLSHNYLTESAVRGLQESLAKLAAEDDAARLIFGRRFASFIADEPLPSGRDATRSHVEEYDRITEEHGYVYMVRDDRPGKDRHHVLLILQGSNGHGQLFIERAHLQKPRGGVAGVFSAILHGVVRVEPRDPVRQLSSLKHLKYKRWRVSQDDLRLLRDNIGSEEDKHVDWTYCLHWAKGHLNKIGIQFEEGILELFPEHVLQRQERPDDPPPACVIM